MSIRSRRGRPVPRRWAASSRTMPRPGTATRNCRPSATARIAFASRSTPAAPSPRRRPTSSSPGCAHRSTCWDRCWRAAARRGSRCPAATTSVAASSTCTSAGCRRWAPSSTSCTVSSRLGAGRCAAPGSCSTSRASAPPRTCSPRPSWRRGRRCSTTPPASPRSATWRRSSTAWARRSRAPGRRRSRSTASRA